MWQSSLLLCLILQNSEPSVQELLARIDALERRVEQLEAERKPPDPPARPVAAVYAVSHDPASHDAAPAAAAVQASAEQTAAAQPQFPSLELRGFSDLHFSGSDQKGAHSG